MNKTLSDTAKKMLKDLLAQCTEPQQRMFKLMYGRNNGKRSVEDLAKLSQQVDTEQLLGQLLDQDFIEPVAAAVPESSAPAPLADGTARPATSLKEAQRFAVRRLTDVMGPNAEELCLRIEAARNLHDLQQAVAKAEGTLRQFVNSHAAAEFIADIQAHMPSA